MQSSHGSGRNSKTAVGILAIQQQGTAVQAAAVLAGRPSSVFSCLCGSLVDPGMSQGGPSTTGVVMHQSGKQHTARMQQQQQQRQQSHIIWPVPQPACVKVCEQMCCYFPCVTSRIMPHSNCMHPFAQTLFNRCVHSSFATCGSLLVVNVPLCCVSWCHSFVCCCFCCCCCRLCLTSCVRRTPRLPSRVG